MKVLVITDETQGQRRNDFVCANVGEVAKFGSQCDRGTVDDKCGCHRAMIGMDSLKASTTVKVIESEMTREDLEARLANDFINNWKFDAAEAAEMAKDDANELIKLADYFPVNSVIEIRGSKFIARKVA